MVMVKANYLSTPLPITEEIRRELIVRFLAELLQNTGSPEKQEDFQAALQMYCDSLKPWLQAGDGPPNPRAVFSLLEECSFDESGENMTVVFSPEAEALFRAWLRRNKIWSDTGLNTAPAWLN